MVIKMNRVLITGGSGFIGSHLLSKLKGKYDIYSLERYVTGRPAQPKQYKTVFGDLCDFHAIGNIIRQVRPEIVIHLAAISPVSYSYVHPHEVIEVNLMGTMNLAEKCLKLPNFEQFLMASTSETYGFVGETPKTETTRQMPNSPYAVSKKACEDYLTYMCRAHNFPVTILRPFNSYGRKKNYHFLVEKTVVQMLKKKETCQLGDPTPVRDFMYVNDHVNAYLTCLENEKAIGEIFNFCTGIGYSIKEVVDLINEITGFGGKVIWGTIPERPLDIKILIGSNRKAKKILGWEPKFSLREGLQCTVDYWKRELGKNEIL